MDIPRKNDPQKRDELVLRQGDDVTAIAQKKLSRQYIKFAGTTVLFGVVVFAAIYFIKGEVTRIKAAKAEEQWAVNGVNAIATLGSDKDKAEKIIGDMEERLPSDIEVPIKLIPAIKKFASLSGIAHEPQIDVKGVSAAANGSPGVDFEMIIDAPLTSLIDFLGSFEKAYLARVSSWKLTPSGANEYQMVVDGIMFIR
jgi:hypothetical protein